MKEPENNRDYPEYAEYTQEHRPWDSIYQTGCTDPPKSHGGLIAGLLAVIILLGGIASALGLLNIRLFRQMQSTPDPNGDMLTLIGTQPTQETQATEAVPENTVSASNYKSSGDVTIELRQTPESIDHIPQEGGLSLQAIYEKNIPSVVSITSYRADGSSTSGTGVVLRADGYLVTNSHVVENADTISAQFSDGTVQEATLVGSDTMTDLAVLHVQADSLTPAEFGDSARLRVGDTAAAIGDPLGTQLRGTMTEGIISGINRDISVGGRTMTLIQTTAALNQGNSGGPLINCYGQVVGINTMKIGDYMSTAGVEGLGFAIPSTTVKEVVDQLASQGYVSGRPSLGLEVEAISRFYQSYYGLPTGAYITGVRAGSDAEAKGLIEGDILLSLNGSVILDQDDLTQVLYSCQVGDVLEAVVFRGNKRYTLELTVEELIANP